VDDDYGGSGESDCVAMVAPRTVATTLLDGGHDGGPEMRRRWLGMAAAVALGGDGSRSGARWGRQPWQRSVGTAAKAALDGDVSHSSSTEMQRRCVWWESGMVCGGCLSWLGVDKS
jgi:hypothetical protein